MYKKGDILIYRWEHKSIARRGFNFHGKLFKVRSSPLADDTIMVVIEVDSNFKPMTGEGISLTTKNLFPYTKQTKQEIICDKIKYLEDRWNHRKDLSYA